MNLVTEMKSQQQGFLAAKQHMAMSPKQGDIQSKFWLRER